MERANQSLLSRRGSADKRAGPDFPIGLPLNSRKRRRTTSSLNSPNSTHSVGVGNTNEVRALQEYPSHLTLLSCASHYTHTSHCLSHLTLHSHTSHCLSHLTLHSHTSHCLSHLTLHSHT